MRSGPGLQLILLAHPQHPRVASLQAALAAAGEPPARVFPWTHWLTAPAGLRPLLQAGPRGQVPWLKIEAPGEDAQCEALLLSRGAALADQPPPPALAHGETGFGRLRFLGLTDALNELAALVAEYPDLKVFSPPQGLLTMADKLACQEQLAAAGVSVPPRLGPIPDFASLTELLADTGWRRVFLKPRYGSSASGVVALHHDGRQGFSALTALALTADSSRPGGFRCFNSLLPRRYRDRDCARLVDALAGEALYGEAWIPKPRQGEHHYDLRIVTLGGIARHRVARLSRHPLTNLHLGNARGEVTDLLAPARIEAMEACARAVAKCFPQQPMTALDMIVHREREHVLEVNGCGDWLPRLTHQDETVHAAEIRWMQSQPAHV